VSAIAIAGLDVVVGGRQVLHGIDFAAERGTVTAICGPNGAGKSTLIRALAGVQPGASPARRAEPRRVAYLAQGARCTWALTVDEVVSLGRIPYGDRAAAPIERALAACGIARLRYARIDRISGGEARRAMIARVLASEPEVLLLDEPTADLDPAAAYEIFRLLVSLAREGRTVVVALHAIDLAIGLADRIVLMADGRVAGDLPAANALPALAQLFGLSHGSDPAPRLLPPR
jgi:iron complex transport system ATP-binding protein